MADATSRPDHVLAELRRRIHDGELPEGAKLPSVRALAATYGIDRNHAEQVITDLRHDGLIITKPGAGSYVRRFRAIPRSSPARLARAGWESGRAIQDADTRERPRTVDIRTGEAAAPPWATEALGLPAGATTAFRSRRFEVDGRSVQLADSWLPVDIVRGTQIMHTDTGPGGTYARLAELGHAPTHFVEYLRARMPRPEEAERLELPPGTPVLEITRHAYEESGRCVEVNRMILDGTAYLVDYSFPA